jgi:hypothetical protein
MGASDRRKCLFRFVIVVAVSTVACSGDTPTTPSTPTPTPAPTVQGCSASAPQPMTSFSASSATIVDGDSFALSWTAPCGSVSIGIKGQSPFILNQPTSGSYQLKPGLPGYPTAPGDTIYEATNGDVAQRFTATVMMKAKLQVSVSASPDSCHPQKWNSKACTVTCSADTTGGNSGALSYQWSGCASGSGSTGTCTFSQPGSADCNVAVTDSKGVSATASKTVQGSNAAPGVTNPRWYYTGVPCTYKNCWFFLTPTDDDPQPSSSIVSCSAEAVSGTTGCGLLPGGAGGNGCYPNMTLSYDSGLAINMETNTSGTICQLRVTITDDWGTSTVWTSQRYTIP